jgi:hypothetical protein
MPIPNPSKAISGYGITVLDNMDSVSPYTALGDETANLAVSDNRVEGAKAIEFDKVNATETTKIAGADRAIASVDLSSYPLWSILVWHVYLSSLSDVDKVLIRIGTDASNYLQYEIEDTHLEGGWNLCAKKLGEPAESAGTGCDFSAVAYLAVGVEFDAENDTLADIAFDEISVVGAPAGSLVAFTSAT